MWVVLMLSSTFLLKTFVCRPICIQATIPTSCIIQIELHHCLVHASPNRCPIYASARLALEDAGLRSKCACRQPAWSRRGCSCSAAPDLADRAATSGRSVALFRRRSFGGFVQWADCLVGESVLEARDVTHR